MQDNISKMNDNLEDANSGCDKIDDTLKRKQLSVNYDKSKYLLSQMNETFMGLNGLSHECRQLTEMMGIPDIMANLVSIGEIKQAVARHSNQEMTDEIQSSTKVGDNWSDDPMDNTYLKYMSHQTAGSG